MYKVGSCGVCFGEARNALIPLGLLSPSGLRLVFILRRGLASLHYNALALKHYHFDPGFASRLRHSASRNGC